VGLSNEEKKTQFDLEEKDWKSPPAPRGEGFGVSKSVSFSFSRSGFSPQWLIFQFFYTWYEPQTLKMVFYFLVFVHLLSILWETLVCFVFSLKQRCVQRKPFCCSACFPKQVLETKPVLGNLQGWLGSGQTTVAMVSTDDGSYYLVHLLNPISHFLHFSLYFSLCVLAQI